MVHTLSTFFTFKLFVSHPIQELEQTSTLYNPTTCKIHLSIFVVLPWSHSPYQHNSRNTQYFAQSQLRSAAFLKPHWFMKAMGRNREHHCPHIIVTSVQLNPPLISTIRILLEIFVYHHLRNCFILNNISICWSTFTSPRLYIKLLNLALQFTPQSIWLLLLHYLWKQLYRIAP